MLRELRGRLRCPGFQGADYPSHGRLLASFRYVQVFGVVQKHDHPLSSKPIQSYQPCHLWVGRSPASGVFPIVLAGGCSLSHAQVLKQQIKEITSNPENLKKLPHSTTIYHELLRPELYYDGSIPDPGSLYEESQALMFGGADTTGTALMHGSFYILTRASVYEKLKAELQEAWPSLEEPPSLAALEKLPYLVSPPSGSRQRRSFRRSRRP